VFVQSTSELQRPYLRLRRALMDGPAWLASLASPALIEALGVIPDKPINADHDATLGRLRDTFRCEVGPIRLHVDAITVPLQWLNRVEPSLFPPVLDTDLRLTSHGPTHSQLTIYGSYPRTQPPNDPTLIYQTVQTVLDTYLRNVTTTLHNQTT
jgi:hypothetical protein